MLMTAPCMGHPSRGLTCEIALSLLRMRILAWGLSGLGGAMCSVTMAGLLDEYRKIFIILGSLFGQPFGQPFWAASLRSSYNHTCAGTATRLIAPPQ